jgi:hypothetical protein
MLPTFVDDLGTGTHSMSSNSPYITYTHTVNKNSLATTFLRVPFRVLPMIPINSSQQTFTFSISAQTNNIKWATVIYDWDTTAPDITLQIDTSPLVSSTTEPAQPYIFELAGRVGFVYGPNNVVLYEDRILRVMIYLQFSQTTAQRSLTTYFQGPTTSSTGQSAWSSSASAKVPAVRLMDNEVFVFNCGGVITDTSQQCTFGTTLTTSTTTTTTTTPDIVTAGANSTVSDTERLKQINSVIWGSDSSQITVNSGVLRVIGPMYTNGAILVQTGATLIVDAGKDQSLTLFSITKNPLFVNNGAIHIISGTLRIIGTSMLGSGNIIVGINGKLEIDSQSTDITFGLETQGGNFSTVQPRKDIVLSTSGYDFNKNGQNLLLPAIYSEGYVTFISGRHTFLRSFVMLATSYFRIGAAAELILQNPQNTYPQTNFPNYVVGGLNNGNIDQSNFTAMNELSLICGGSIVVSPKSKLIFGATVKFDGLGRLSLQDKSILSIYIPFYTVNGSTDTNASSTAGIYFNGPQTERPDGAGLLCKSCTISIERGGIISSSGVKTYSDTNITINNTGFFHFTGKYSSNLLTGTKLTNNGDILILNGATIDFDLVIESFTHVRVLDSTSTIYLSSKSGLYKFYRPAGTRYSPTNSIAGSSTGTNAVGGVVANNPTHLFALYVPGIVIIRDGVTVQLVTDVTTPLSSVQGAKYFVGGLYNAGTLFVDQGVDLEMFTYTQSIEPTDLINVTPHEFTKTPAGTVIDGLKGSVQEVDNLPNDQNLVTDGIYTLHTSPNLVLLTKTSSVSQVSYNKYVYVEAQGVIYDIATATADVSTTQLNFNVIYGHVLSAIGSVGQGSNGVVVGNSGTLTIPKGFNVPLSLYQYATFTPGLTIPFPEAILADGRPVLVLDANGVNKGQNLENVQNVNTNLNNFKFALKSSTAVGTSMATVNKNKSYQPNIMTTWVNSLIGAKKASFNFEVFFNPDTKAMYADQIIINPTLYGVDASGTKIFNNSEMVMILDNVVVNVFTNLKTTTQTINLSTPITIDIPQNSSNNVALGAVMGTLNDLGSNNNGHTSTTMSLETGNNDVEYPENVKYPYKPNIMLNQDEQIEKFQNIEKNQNFAQKYFPSFASSNADALLGRSDPRAHLDSNQIPSMSGMNRNGQTQNTFTLFNTADHVPLETAAQNTQNGQQVKDLSEYYQFKLPIIQFFNSKPPASAMSISISTINIFSVDHLNGNTSTNGGKTDLENGIILTDGNHKYNPKTKDNLAFLLEFENYNINLIGYNGQKSSAAAFATMFATIIVVIALLF